MAQIPTVTQRGNARNNFLYGSNLRDGIDGGLGDDYLRGYMGDDYLWGGAGSDRFVFERTQLQNGIDSIMDYTYNPTAGGGEMDVLDFSLVGFARNALSRNGTIDNGIDNVVRFMAIEGGGAQVMISLTGAGGATYTQWAVLEGLYVGNLVHFRIGEHTYTRPVQGAEPGNVLRYDIGNGDRDGDGVVDEWDAADDDDLFDDPLTAGGYGAEVLIGDRVRGFGGTTAFTPGATALDVPEWLWSNGEGDGVDEMEYQVYYGTYDAATDIFTVTSTPGTTADPTSATHTMVLYDKNPQEWVDSYSGSDNLGGWVFAGVYAESQWYIDSDTGMLNYDTNGFIGSEEMDVLDTENVLYGTADDEMFNGGAGIDIIYAGAGNDLLFGGSSAWVAGGGGNDLLPDGNDWLFGGDGADIFFATNVLDGGIDTIKDFKGTEGDLIALAVDPSLIDQDFQSETPWDGWTNLADAEEALLDIGTVTGATLADALLAASGPEGSIHTDEALFNVYWFTYDSKTYLFWDALGDGYAEGGDYDDTLVEITGAAALTAESIYLIWGMG